jgi:hypothetical protein
MCSETWMQPCHDCRVGKNGNQLVSEVKVVRISDLRLHKHGSFSMAPARARENVDKAKGSRATRKPEFVIVRVYS